MQQVPGIVILLSVLSIAIVATGMLLDFFFKVWWVFLFSFVSGFIMLAIALFILLHKLLKKDYRVIFKDRNGLIRIFGLYVGLTCDSINYTTGNSKSDFNGFRLDFKGKEEKGSYFINNLADAGFVFEVDFRITQSGDFRVTQSGEYRIIQ